MGRAIGNQGIGTIMRSSRGSGGQTRAASDLLGERLEQRRGAGEQIPAETRSMMESRIGADFSGVRVHADGEAASMSGAIGARAFTLGSDIYFGAGEYRPGTTDGERLLAHELTHTIQQGASPVAGETRASAGVSGAGTIQRQETPSSAPAAITARSIIPFPEGSSVRMDRIMSDLFFGQMADQDPDSASGFNAVDRQTATITVATDDEVSGTVAGSVTIPAVGNRPAKTVTGVTLRLRRRQDQAGAVFDLELLWQEQGETAPQVRFGRTGMTAAMSGGAIVLSQGGSPILRSSVNAAGDTMTMEAFTAPYMSQIPQLLRGMVPARVDLLSVRRLPGDAASAPAGADTELANRASSLPRRGAPPSWRRQIMGGIGVQHGAVWDPVLTSSWQVSFMPSPMLGSLIQVPIEIQVQYAPPESVLASVSSGFEVSLSQLQIPVNVRVINLGFAGGVIHGEEPPGGGARPPISVGGPMLGIGGGLEIGHFRLDLRYDHIFNLFESAPGIPEPPDVNTLSIRAGGVW